ELGDSGKQGLLRFRGVRIGCEHGRELAYGFLVVLACARDAFELLLLFLRVRQQRNVSARDRRVEYRGLQRVNMLKADVVRGDDFPEIALDDGHASDPKNRNCK